MGPDGTAGGKGGKGGGGSRDLEQAHRPCHTSSSREYASSCPKGAPPPPSGSPGPSVRRLRLDGDAGGNARLGTEAMEARRRHNDSTSASTAAAGEGEKWSAAQTPATPAPP